MKGEFGTPEDLSQAPDIFHNRDLMLSPRQAEIYRNLEAIGPEIAAFYLSAVKVLQKDDIEASSYLLAHVAREIEGGLRDVLSTDQEKRKIQKQLKKTDLGDLNERIGHIASILAALGIDDLRVPLAQRWINVATRFHEFAHRHGAWEAPREKETFVPLWREFEDILVELVGTHFNLLDRLDRILDYREPTEEILKTLPHLLKSAVRYAYFFNKLDSPAWLKSLKDAGWFDIESNPSVYDVPDETGAYAVSPWYALAYLEKVINYIKEHPCDETVRTLAAIVNDVVTHINNNQEQAMHPSTVWQIVKIICALPTKWLEQQHITFVCWALRWGHQLLIENEIDQTFLPKLLKAEAKELTLAFLKVMLNNYKIIVVMEKQGAAIVKLCGVEAVNIAVEHIQEMINQGASSFEIIQPIKSGSPEDIPRNHSEMLVSFTSSLFRLTEPESIAEMVENLLKKSHTIFKQIALNAIKHHYSNLKRCFWEWQGNPLEETLLKPELYQLIQTNCRAFDESEIEQILRWIESEQDLVSSEDDEIRSKQGAYRKREWLSALMEMDNEKVISTYQKYERINPAKLEHPGLLIWTEVWFGNTSPTTIEELSGMSNAQIAEFLNNFIQEGIAGPSEPSEEGLRETFEGYVATNPQRFTDDLQSFFVVDLQYQYSLLQGFLKAWRDKKEFDWTKLLNFIDRIFSSEQFWSKQQETRFDYRNWLLSAIADLIEVGTKDDTHAFDAQLLPLAEKILLILVEKVEPERPVTVTRNGFSTVDLPATFLNTTKGKVFSAMVNYALRFARLNNVEQGSRWPQAIKADFTKRLDRSVESSIGFSFVLGAYLPNLLYLDEKWVIDNINCIFPRENEYHWYAAFSGYLFYVRTTYTKLYSLLKEYGHYQKALNSDFGDMEVDQWDSESLISDIYVGWMENWETLDDETSLIYQLINSDNSELLSTLIHFFWKQRDNLPEEMKAKLRPTWYALFESLRQKSDVEKYEEVLSRLSVWVIFIDKIDGEVLEWLKMSTQYIRGFTDSTFFVEGLLKHVHEMPAEVGEIYLGMLTHDVYPYHDQEHIQEIIRVLYSTGHKEGADQICNLYGEAGFDFLRSLYDENQN